MSTIHAIKGEARDATLILETKFPTLFDSEQMVPFLVDLDLQPVFDPEHPKTAASNRATFMKRTYVAASRAPPSRLHRNAPRPPFCRTEDRPTG
ncbi:MAG: hypothetical protein M9945_05195 [Aquamicrobium sp.]|uniref:hypothetical protein n=1 Tax=Aquamicrobium sp. TaxID=1872579 RepID=UPI00349EBED5|nr:hypothetical protein [Aquamicrobium sp.]